MGFCLTFMSANLLLFAGKKPHHTLCGAILEECHATFANCFHAFYPSNKLKWDLLCGVLGLRNVRHDPTI